MRALLLMGIVALWVVPERAQAQLVTVKETVYGMDCAPCAYGVERRLGRMEGVQEVVLSLNEGTAELVLALPNTVALAAIRRSIRQSGFSGEGGHVSVRGVLERVGEAAALRTPAGEVFVLGRSPAGTDLDLAAGTQVEAAGPVDKDTDAEGHWILRAERLERIGAGGS